LIAGYFCCALGIRPAKLAFLHHFPRKQPRFEGWKNPELSQNHLADEAEDRLNAIFDISGCLSLLKNLAVRVGFFHRQSLEKLLT
jgi:hypothetical protein